MDIALLLLLALLVATPIARAAFGRITGPAYDTRAEVTFVIDRAAAEAVNLLEKGEALTLADGGAPFGSLRTLSFSVPGNSLTATGTGSIELYGEMTDAGFRTREGVFVLPYEKYEVAGSSCVVPIMVTEVNVTPAAS